MLPLQASHFPTSAAELETALAGGLAQHGLKPKNVTAAGSWPALEKLTIDLTGAQATRDLRLPAARSGEGADLTIAELLVRAEPLLLEGSPLALRLQAQQARFGPATAQSGTGGPMLYLRGSGPGQLSVSMQRLDLQRLALEAGKIAAKQHGADVQELELEFESQGDRALRFAAKVVAKMGFMKATLLVTGHAEVDSSLQLRLSGLEVKGQGMASTVAAGFIRPQLEKAQQKPIPLAMLAFGDVRLKDIRLTTANDVIRAEAEFSR